MQVKLEVALISGGTALCHCTTNVKIQWLKYLIRPEMCRVEEKQNGCDNDVILQGSSVS